MRPLVIYHGPTCWDGFCCAWLFHRHVDQDAEFVPGIYGDPPPDVVGRDVYVLDFSYSRETLEAMHRDAASLVVLDHHKTAQADLEGLPYCTFDMELSGAQLTHAWLLDHGYNVGQPHWLVEYTADRDLWRWALPDSKAINAYLRSFPLDFAIWDRIARYAWENPKYEAITQGEAILRAESVTVGDHVARAHEIEMDGHRILAVNATTLFSEIAGALADGRPFGAAWFERPGHDGPVRQWSLRSRDAGVDVSTIAKAHGGGGHRNAAGFEEAR